MLPWSRGLLSDACVFPSESFRDDRVGRFPALSFNSGSARFVSVIETPESIHAYLGVLRTRGRFETCHSYIHAPSQHTPDYLHCTVR